MHFFRNKISYVIYLIDANILIYAENKKDRRSMSCNRILEFKSPKIKIGTTNVILDEVKENKNIDIPETFK